MKKFMQLWFGKYYLGLLLLAVVIFLIYESLK